MKISSILGLNARTQLFAYRYNTKRGKNIADSKIQTAKILKKANVSHPKIYKKFTDPRDVFEFDWASLPDKFALKPSRGMGGEGIIVVKKRLKDGGWLTTQKERVAADDLRLHVLDTLEGAFSMGNVPDVAFIQEYVGRAKAFRRWAYRGTPDIRIIVFNKVPVMAMLRLPTKESGGRANLHQGALGVGVDIATGITTKAIWHGEQVVFKPGTERKLRGIKIPGWTMVLETAVKAQIASGLGYVGVDIVVHPEKGPMVLELNAQPGLQIQLANMEGLKKRLERVEDLDVTDAEHGVNLAKALFAGRFENRKALEEGIKTISVWEEVKIVDEYGKRRKFFAKIDTGAWRTSIDKELAKSLGLLAKGNILWSRKIRTSLGQEERPIINLRFYLAGRKINTLASISTRKNLRVPIIIGRRDLTGFVVSSTYQNKPSTWVPPMWSK
ncbi:MAG TPA: sugar-transfer associated ATP-grasp domain-containing protein [Candidatus Saccharimonadales bacterium]|jgi:alpha-L-glutamate ligase-like protein|nr:sugar-transfer associated ATP-grasp domain-containing protein [Candidatus Saccharimonadales bacterium]